MKVFKIWWRDRKGTHDEEVEAEDVQAAKKLFRSQHRGHQDELRIEPKKKNS